MAVRKSSIVPQPQSERYADPFVVNDENNETKVKVNPEFIKLKTVTLVGYIILGISAQIVFITYLIISKRIRNVVNLKETDNYWTFIVLFTTTSFTQGVSGGAIILATCMKGRLQWKTFAVLDLLICCFWFSMLWVGLGATEESQDRRLCSHPEINCTRYNAPLAPTKFGKYILTHCGNETQTDLNLINRASSILNDTLDENITELNLDDMTNSTLNDTLDENTIELNLDDMTNSTMNDTLDENATEMNLNNMKNSTMNDTLDERVLSTLEHAKCAAALDLQTAIFCMYIWAAELMLFTIIDAIFGLGSCKGRVTQQFIIYHPSGNNQKF